MLSEFAKSLPPLDATTTQQLATANPIMEDSLIIPSRCCKTRRLKEARQIGEDHADCEQELIEDRGKQTQ